MTTEREKFEKWAKSYESVMSNRPIDSTEQLISYLDVQFGLDQTEDCWNSWQACAKQKQVEIDALRDELEQVKAHNVMLLEAFSKEGSCQSWCYDSTHQEDSDKGLCACGAWKIRKEQQEALSATSESIQAYRQELIAKAKEEQKTLTINSDVTYRGGVTWPKPSEFSSNPPVQIESWGDGSITWPNSEFKE